MRFRRFVFASLALFTVALIWNAFVHLVVLRQANAAVAHLHRPDLSDKLWLSLLLTLALSGLIVAGYAAFARTGSLREGLGYGIFLALLAGLLVDLNQYILYPIPATVALLWFLGGLLEFSLYGVLLSRLFPPVGRR